MLILSALDARAEKLYNKEKKKGARNPIVMSITAIKQYRDTTIYRALR